MPHALLADALLVFHGLFILFVLCGSLLLRRWPRIAWLHLPAVAWAAWVAWAGWICPLTPLENALRHHAGQAGYSGGFIDHYLTAAIYPHGLTRPVQIGIGVLVAVMNVAAYVLWLRRAAAAAEPSLHPESAAGH